MNGRAWTVRDDNLIKYMRQQGKSIKQIAVLLNRTEKAVGNRINRLGLPNIVKPNPVSNAGRSYHRWMKDEDALITETIEELAEYLNVTVKQLTSHIRVMYWGNRDGSGQNSLGNS